MCPSFRATGEEQHSTRGRARLLHEMLAGEVVTDGWRSTEVRDALDLCLSCKGCRSDCPVGVDMATYKAEFLYHHYKGRPRPAAHYAMGRLPLWLRLAAPVAPLVNAAARVPMLSAIAKRLGGIAPERTIPRLAPETFGRGLRRGRRPGQQPPRPIGAPGGNPVSGLPEPGPTETGLTETGLTGPGPTAVLWPDTFTEYLSPSVGHAAVRVMEAAGIDIVAPPRGGGGGGRVCCGLTYVSTGQLDRARKVMRRTLDRMGPLLHQGLPVVVLEPSCAATLVTDLPELLGDDPRAARLAASVRTFAQVLEECAPDWRPPRLDSRVVGQTHCHQHAVLGDRADRRLRDRAGLTGELSGGCCGLAGNFGFERGHYDVSVACAEDQLLPSVRAAEEGSRLLADGFSCRTQLAQLGGHRARHLAEVLADGLTDENRPGDEPEEQPGHEPTEEEEAG
jgi:Fe-S oxidoreductase